MDAFSPIPDHTGFKARNLFADGQQILKGGAFAKIARGHADAFNLFHPLFLDVFRIVNQKRAFD